MVLAFLALQTKSAFDFRVEPQGGLYVEARGIPLIRGSSIQFFKPGWTKGYFSSAGGSGQRVVQVDTDTVRLDIDSQDHLVRGSVTYKRYRDHLQVHYDLTWSGQEDAAVEATAAYLWTPAFDKGLLTADDKATRPLDSYAYAGADLESRRFSPDAQKYSFSSPVGAVTVTSTIPLALFDGRGFAQAWAKNNQYFWLGALELPAPRGRAVTFDVDYQIDVVGPLASLSAIRAEFKGTPTSAALLPDTAHPILIPKPQSARLDWDHPLVYTNALAFPVGQFDHLDVFQAAMARRFQLPAPGSKKIPFDAGISKLGFVPGGYRITITDHSLSVLGEEDEGLQDGLQRLAALAFVSNGHICFPTGTVTDQPQTDWRGVHLFVGNKAMLFQSRLWTRVLRPLGFNKVVLQCERTRWDSTPGIETGETMSKADLVKLFGMYRRLGVDPIPLIQSYGHMEWLFANGKNLEIAYNPEKPYSVDPRKAGTQTVLTKLWDEAIATLHPDTIHFGLDEVDMVGMPENPSLETELWAKQLGLLESIAKSHGVQMMLWGDQGLAPGEAPDATLGDSKEEAANRRNAIPRGSLIGDWHYVANSDPKAYRTNLQLWKDAGMRPIASTWYEPANIAGFDVEAGLLNCGTLQTTWCGYESSEEGMLQAFNQFSAMVLAADYSWSGRRDLPGSLEYDPAAVFRKMYFGQPSALSSIPGEDLGLTSSIGVPFEVGQVRYGIPCNLVISSLIQPTDQPRLGIHLDLAAHASRLGFAFNTLVPSPEDGDPVAELAISLSDGKIIRKKLEYGVQIRASSDRRPTALADRSSDGLCSLLITLGESPVKVTGVDIHPLNRYSGFRLRGLEAIGQ